jgi:prepilin-type N-terminal cleavage/methylation domain-containing protein
MVSLKQRQSGFTIVELLIVIVIIGILATLVIVTFSGVQQKARDSERKTDINAIAGQLEAVYASKGYYPNTAEVNDATWRSNNEFRIDMKAFADPKNKDTQTLTDVAPASVPADNITTPGTYNYYYSPDDCSDVTENGVTVTQCTKYVIYSYLEGKEPTAIYKRQSTN